MTYYIFEIASKFESSRAPVSHQLCPFLCFISSPYKSIFLLPNLRRNKGVLIHIMIEILDIPLPTPASSKPREWVPLSVGVVSDAHWNSSYTWIYWPHFCLKPPGKTQNPNSFTGHVVRSWFWPILFQSAILYFPGIEQIKRQWACVSVHICTLYGGRDRTWKERDKKSWPIYWEGRRPNCTCKILLNNKYWISTRKVDVWLKHLIQKKERGKSLWQWQVRVVILPPTFCRMSINTQPSSTHRTWVKTARFLGKLTCHTIS